jgi:hypothetical protein
VLKSLEDHIKERQHHLNESSSARLRRSKKSKILPSLKSKSLGAPHIHILIGAEISTSALFLSYIMWRSNFTIPHRLDANICRIYFGSPHKFAANICRQHLTPTFAAYISEIRIHLRHTFAAYICRLHFVSPPIF